MLKTIGLKILLLFVVVIINWIVDPYDVYRVFSFNMLGNKPVAIKNTRLHKSYLVSHLRPRTIALGSSRVIGGIDPEHPGWNPSLRPVYNLGIPSACMDEMLRYFKIALDCNKVEQVVVGLDFYMFNVHQMAAIRRMHLDQQEWGPSLDSAGSFYAHTLLTTTSFLASYDTLRSQDPIRHPSFMANGQMVWTSDLRRARKYGQRVRFRESEGVFLGDVLRPEPDHRFAFFDPSSGKSAFEYFRRFLRLALQNNVDLKLFICPVHARHLEVIIQAGLWQQFEQWKRELVLIIEQETLKAPVSDPFFLWDFSGYNPITTEPVPPLGDTDTLMAYYWDSSHFKNDVGNLILDRLFDLKDPNRFIPKDFGRVIDTENIEMHLLEIKKRQQAYRQTHFDEIKEIEAIKKQFSWYSRIICR